MSELKPKKCENKRQIYIEPAVDGAVAHNAKARRIIVKDKEVNNVCDTDDEEDSQQR